MGGGLFKVRGQLGRLRWTFWTVVDNCKCGLWWTVGDSVVDTVDCGEHTLDTFAWIGGAAGKCGEEDWEFSLSGICRTMLQRFMLRGPTKR